MDNSRVKKGGIFDAIAPVYGLFYDSQVKHYRNILKKAEKMLGLSAYRTILDIGCGTGALCFALGEAGFQATGVDASRKMIKQSEKRDKLGMDFKIGNALEGLDFEDKSFDIVISSYVAHGLKREDRIRFYAESARLARHKVIFHEYNEKRRLITDIAEWLEDGDYFYFIKNAEREMKENFADVEVINISDTASWYVCTPK